MKKTNKQAAPPTTAQVSFRLPADLRQFYEKLAEAERRRLSDTLRIALEDHARRLSEQVAA